MTTSHSDSPLRDQVTVSCREFLRHAVSLAKEHFGSGVVPMCDVEVQVMEPTKPGYRFRVRGSVLLAKQRNEKRHHLRVLRDLYELRSRIVHGQTVSTQNLDEALPKLKMRYELSGSGISTIGTVNLITEQA